MERFALAGSGERGGGSLGGSFRQVRARAETKKKGNQWTVRFPTPGGLGAGEGEAGRASSREREPAGFAGGQRGRGKNSTWGDASIAPMPPEAVAHRVSKAQRAIEDFVLGHSANTVERLISHMDSLPVQHRHGLMASLLQGQQRMAAATLAVQQMADEVGLMECVNNVARRTHEALGSEQVVLHTDLGVLGDGVIQTLKLLAGFSRSAAKYVGNDIIAAEGSSKDSRGLVGHCCDNRETIVVPNVKNDRRYDESIDGNRILDDQGCCRVFIPAVHKFATKKGVEKAVYGCLVAVFPDEQSLTFFQSDVGRHIMELLGSQAGTVLANSVKFENVRVCAKQLTMAHTVVESLVRCDSLEAAGGILQMHGTQLVGTKSVNIFFLEPKRGQMWRVEDQDYGERTNRVYHPIASGITGECIRKGKVINLEDCTENDNYNADTDGQHSGSILCVPAQLEGDEVVAVITASGKIGRFNKNDVYLIKLVARQVENMIQENRLRSVAVTTMNASISARNVATDLMATQGPAEEGIDYDSILRERMEPAKSILQADRCSVFIIDHDNHEMVSKFRSEDLSHDSELRVPLGRGFASFTATSGEPVIVKDAYQDDRFNQDVDNETGYRTGSVLVVPVLKSKAAKKTFNPLSEHIDTGMPHPDVMGVVQMINKYKGGFTFNDVQTAEAFAASAAGVIESSTAIDDWKRKVERAQRQSANLLEVGKSLSGSLGKQDMINLIMTRAKELVEADRCTFMLWDNTKTVLEPHFTDGPDSISVAKGVGISGLVGATGLAMNVSDCYNNTQFSSEVDKVTGYRTYSTVVVPITGAGGEIYGIIQMLNKKTKHGGNAWQAFDESDEEVLNALASQAAIALENSQVTSAISKAQNLNKDLMSVSMAVSSQQDLSTLFPTIMNHAKELLGADRCTLFLLDEDKDELWSLVANGTQEIRTPKSTGIAGSAATTGYTLNIKDAYLDSRFNPEIDRSTGYRTRSVLCMPIFSHEKGRETIGVIQMINKLSNYEEMKEGGADVTPVHAIFKQEDEEILRTLTGQLAIAIANTKVHHNTVRSNETLTSMVQNLHGTILLLDKKGRLLNCSNAESLLMEGEKEAKATHYRKWIHKNDRLLKDIDRVYEEGADTGNFGYTLTTVNDEEALVDYFISVVGEPESGFDVLIELDYITQEKLMLRTLRQYVTMENAVRLIEDASEGTLETTSPAAVLTAEIRGFKSSSEGKRSLLDFFNKYLSSMTPCIKNEGGSYKILGDKIVATFGILDKRNIEDSSQAACRASLSMSQQLQRLNTHRSMEGSPPIKMAFGVHAGDITSGVIQPDATFDFVFCGETMEQVEFCKSVGKEYISETFILVSNACHEIISSKFMFRELDKVSGEHFEAVRLFELLGESKTDLEPVKGKACNHYREGLGHYKARRWRIASEHFKKAWEVGSDKPGYMLFNRCQGYVESPLNAPMEDWDGSIHLNI